MTSSTFPVGIVPPLVPRDPDEPHRSATPLELLFDLVSVIAIASATAGLHHAIAEGHSVQGVLSFAALFFGIYWAWVNHTWFASAYDSDDTLYRLLTMCVMGGALVMAAGVDPFFDSTELTLIVAGYAIMRLALVVLWLRAAAGDEAQRTTNLIYAAGVSIAQGYWILIVSLRPTLETVFWPLFAAGIALELTVPIIAERRSMTPWHRHHVIERYGLLNIIVLGEILLAVSMALEQAWSGGHESGLLGVAIAALVIVFSMWWLYFADEDHLGERELSRSLTWGLGHIIVFAAGAAAGAGFAVLVDIVSGHSETSREAGVFAVAIPVSLYLLGLWFVRDRFALEGRARWVLPTFALLVPISVWPLGLGGVTALTALAVVVRGQVTGGSGRR